MSDFTKLDQSLHTFIGIDSQYETSREVTSAPDIQANQSSPRRLYESINSWDAFWECTTHGDNKHPCWQAHVVKGFPVEDQWRDTVCCDYLNHNKQCNSDHLHYCVDHAEKTHLNLSKDLDLFATPENFKENLDLIMAMAPAESKACGLEGFGDKLPEIDVVDGSVDLAIQLPKDNPPVPLNSVCKIRINTKFEEDSGDSQNPDSENKDSSKKKKLTFNFGRLPEYIGAAYLVQVDEATRMDHSKKDVKLRDMLSYWGLGGQPRQIVITEQDAIEKNQLWLVYQPKELIPFQFSSEAVNQSEDRTQGDDSAGGTQPDENGGIGVSDNGGVVACDNTKDPAGGVSGIKTNIAVEPSLEDFSMAKECESQPAVSIILYSMIALVVFLTLLLCYAWCKLSKQKKFIDLQQDHMGERRDAILGYDKDTRRSSQKYLADNEKWPQDKNDNNGQTERASLKQNEEPQVEIIEGIDMPGWRNSQDKQSSALRECQATQIDFGNFGTQSVQRQTAQKQSTTLQLPSNILDQPYRSERPSFLSSYTSRAALQQEQAYQFELNSVSDRPQHIQVTDQKQIMLEDKKFLGLPKQISLEQQANKNQLTVAANMSIIELQQSPRQEGFQFTSQNPLQINQVLVDSILSQDQGQPQLTFGDEDDAESVENELEQLRSQVYMQQQMAPNGQMGYQQQSMNGDSQMANGQGQSITLQRLMTSMRENIIMPLFTSKKKLSKLTRENQQKDDVIIQLNNKLYEISKNHNIVLNQDRRDSRRDSSRRPNQAAPGEEQNNQRADQMDHLFGMMNGDDRKMSIRRPTGKFRPVQAIKEGDESSLMDQSNLFSDNGAQIIQPRVNEYNSRLNPKPPIGNQSQAPLPPPPAMSQIAPPLPALAPPPPVPTSANGDGPPQPIANFSPPPLPPGLNASISGSKMVPPPPLIVKKSIKPSMPSLVKPGIPLRLFNWTRIILDREGILGEPKNQVANALLDNLDPNWKGKQVIWVDINQYTVTNVFELQTLYPQNMKHQRQNTNCSDLAGPSKENLRQLFADKTRNNVEIVMRKLSQLGKGQETIVKAVNRMNAALISNDHYHAINVLETLAHNCHVELCQKYLLDHSGDPNLDLEDWPAAEKFMLKLLDLMPTFQLKIKLWLFQRKFPTEMQRLLALQQTAVAGFDKLLTNCKLRKLLGAVLQIGNCLNAGNAKKGQADGFKIKDLQLTTSIKDDKGTSILQFICEKLQRDDQDFVNFKSDFKEAYQVSQTIDISIQYQKFQVECKEAVSNYEEIRKQDQRLEQTPFGLKMQEFFVILNSGVDEIDGKIQDFESKFKETADKYMIAANDEERALSQNLFKFFCGFFDKVQNSMEQVKKPQQRSKSQNMGMRKYHGTNRLLDQIQ